MITNIKENHFSKRKFLHAFLLLFGISIILGPNSVGQQGRLVHYLTVNRHDSVNPSLINKTTVRARFEYASSILQINTHECYGEEVACCVAFALQGDVGTFGGAGLDIIDDEQELNQVWAKPGNFKVVNAINFCEGKGVCPKYINDMLVGCAQCPSDPPNAIVIAAAPGDVWAHEFGHTRGLYDRDDCEKWIMHPTALFTNAVNTWECDSFRVGGVPDKSLCPQTPALSQWGLIILVALIVLSTWVVLRKRKAVGSYL
jgi:hypothetical protein